MTTTAIDTNVLIDLLERNERSADEALARIGALRNDFLVICEMVYAEIASRFPNIHALDEFLKETRVEVVASNREALFRAGSEWVNYARTRPAGLTCRECSTVTLARCSKCEAVLTARQRVLPDFYIASHALVHADRLLTHDKGYFSRYFPALDLI